MTKETKDFLDYDVMLVDKNPDTVNEVIKELRENGVNVLDYTKQYDNSYPYLFWCAEEKYISQCKRTDTGKRHIYNANEFISLFIPSKIIELW